MQQFLDLFSSYDANHPTFPPTEIYNEGWLLRIILNWFSGRGLNGHPLSFSDGSVWFSEALIPSPFLPRFRGDPLGESRTHTDGVIGHIAIGRSGKADLELRDNASQFIVLEAKINSPLSSGTTNAPGYDQAARNVACMAELLHRFDRRPRELQSLAFYVLAPQKKISAGKFEIALDRDAIRAKAEKRASAYQGERDAWLADYFLPLMEKIEIGSLSWEQIFARMGEEDRRASDSIGEFYARCLRFN